MSLVPPFPIDRRNFISGAAVTGLAGGWAHSGLLASPAATKLAAFVVGVDKYQHIRPLERAVADARSIAAKVESFGYQVQLAENVDADGLFRSFDTFYSNLEPNSAVFIYMAAHGIQSAGTNFILPADVAKDGDALLESSVQTGYLLDQIASTRPRQAIVILDACRDEPLEIQLNGRANGFASTNAPGGFYVTYSAGAGQYAIDHLGDEDKHPNGLFVRHLIDQMAPDVLIDDVIKSTREAVLADAQSIGRNQCPAIYDQAGRDVRLDAKKAPARRKRQNRKAGLADTGVLVVGIEKYDEFSSLVSLATPHSDAQRLTADFEELGANVTTLLDPSRGELLASCKEMASRGHERNFVYLAGMGGLIDRGAWLFLQGSSAAASQKKGEAGTRGLAINLKQSKRNDDLTMVAMGEILDAFDMKNVHLLCDFCLEDAQLQSGWQTRFGLSPDVLSNRITGVLDNIRALGQGEGPGNYPQCSVLFAASYYQFAMDAAPGQQRSPFAIALTNALGQPGLTVEQFANYIRREVEDLTDRYQSPMLFCEKPTQDVVLIDTV
ncbi:Caspase domain-containing protein [Parasphingorhabdus marina DSM 22363]|uniref:Caspase domain-containing protein n=1 Tax=Parasphingorhabdus marina DSM 22363 TaxID=1123272 RepID=A0A1N6CUS5_9SPHN|nr:caspase family protein [Parasphingorhabdus marina]SIN62253.1 Caspase domain-containing protein [Parasphingorhabdus marina DSM 22363]